MVWLVVVALFLFLLSVPASVIYWRIREHKLKWGRTWEQRALAVAGVVILILIAGIVDLRREASRSTPSPAASSSSVEREPNSITTSQSDSGAQVTGVRPATTSSTPTIQGGPSTLVSPTPTPMLPSCSPALSLAGSSASGTPCSHFTKPIPEPVFPSTCLPSETTTACDSRQQAQRINWEAAQHQVSASDSDWLQVDSIQPSPGVPLQAGSASTFLISTDYTLASTSVGLIQVFVFDDKGNWLTPIQSPSQRASIDAIPTSQIQSLLTTSQDKRQVTRGKFWNQVIDTTVVIPNGVTGVQVYVGLFPATPANTIPPTSQVASNTTVYSSTNAYTVQ